MSNLPEKPCVEGDLSRFLEAQQRAYGQALSEIRAGRKTSHWIWYIFPQLAGLGSSSTARYYALQGRTEAEAFLLHPTLGQRLRQSVEVLLALENLSAEEIFGYPDVLKLRSCATLFAHLSPKGSSFHWLLDKYYGGEPDPATLRLLGIT